MPDSLQKEKKLHPAQENGYTFTNPLYENHNPTAEDSNLPSELPPSSAGGMSLEDFDPLPPTSAGKLPLDNSEPLPTSSGGGMDLEDSELLPPTASGMSLDDFDMIKPSPAPRANLSSLPSSSAGGMNLASSEIKPAPNKAAISEAQKNLKGIKGNALQIVGGLPTLEAIEQMADGLKLEKISKRSCVADALSSLEKYQQLMTEMHTIPASSFKKRLTVEDHIHLETGTLFCKEDMALAFQALGDFILSATQVLDSADSFLGSHSGSVQKIAPVLATMLVRANMQLPKLANLQNAVSSHLMQSDGDSFNFSDVLIDEGGRGGRLANTGFQNNDTTADISPDAIQTVLNNPLLGTQQCIDNLNQQRREKVEESRLAIQIPTFPIGIARFIFNSEKKAATVEQVVQRYIDRLRPLNVALDDVAEEQSRSDTEVSDVSERRKVHDRKAKYFQLSKLIYQGMQDKDGMTAAAMSSRRSVAKSGSKFAQLAALGGISLEAAVAQVNKAFRDPNTFAKLQNAQGEDLHEGADYIVGGGEKSIAIIDKINRRVMRAPKEDGRYLSLHDQKTATNGIYDDAIDKVSQFMGFNVIAKANAANFVAKNRFNGKSKNVMGGSLMELAKGETAFNFRLMLNKEHSNTGISRYNGKNHSLAISEQGRMFEDLMKLQVIDYICLHSDRHMGNFFINTKAGAEESTVTGIDNDLLFGMTPNGNEVGYDQSAAALASINDRSRVNHSSRLTSAFPMMTETVRNALLGFDLEQLDKLLTPYVDRVARMAALHRAGELKTLAAEAPICDLSTEEGTEAFTKVMLRNSMGNWVQTMKFIKTPSGGTAFQGLATTKLGSLVLLMVSASYGVTSEASNANYSTKDVLRYLKLIGLSKDEAKKLLLENLHKATADTLVNEQDLEPIEVLNDLDLPLEEFDKKHGFDKLYLAPPVNAEEEDDDGDDDDIEKSIWGPPPSPSPAERNVAARKVNPNIWNSST